MLRKPGFQDLGKPPETGPRQDGRPKDDIQNSNERRKFGVLEKQAQVAGRRLNHLHTSIGQAERPQGGFERNQVAKEYSVKLTSPASAGLFFALVVRL